MQWTRPIAAKTGTTPAVQVGGFVGIVPEAAGAVITFDNSRSPRPLCDQRRRPAGGLSGGTSTAARLRPGRSPGHDGYLAGQPVMPLPPPADDATRGRAASRVPDGDRQGRR